jgi:hypothetical protein
MDEKSPVSQRVSLFRCKRDYGRYLTFPLYPLYTAVLMSGKYDLRMFTRCFKLSGINHRDNPQFAEYLDGLIYENKGHLTYDETLFYLQASTLCTPVSDEELESNMQMVTRDGKERKILKSHARMIGKAILYWKDFFHIKFESWWKDYEGALGVWRTRGSEYPDGIERWCSCDEYDDDESACSPTVPLDPSSWMVLMPRQVKCLS